MTADISPEKEKEIYHIVFNITKRKGLKATTMDNVAAALKMSKRTLYELYGSKEQLISLTLAYFNNERVRIVEELFANSPTAMEAFYLSMRYHMKLMKETCAEFFHDLDAHARHFREIYEENDRNFRRRLKEAIQRGIEQGVFRADEDYDIAIQMFTIQLESLKRMEDIFPPEITLGKVQNVIGVNFLRSIATIKGLEVLDECVKKFNDDIE